MRSGMRRRARAPMAMPAMAPAERPVGVGVVLGGEDGDEVLRDGRVGVEGLGEGEVGAVVVDG